MVEDPYKLKMVNLETWPKTYEVITTRYCKICNTRDNNKNTYYESTQYEKNAKKEKQSDEKRKSKVYH